MPYRYRVVTSVLEKMGLAGEWDALRPYPDDLGGSILIQNQKGVQVEVLVSTEEVGGDLTEEKVTARIQTAIVVATQLS